MECLNEDAYLYITGRDDQIATSTRLLNIKYEFYGFVISADFIETIRLLFVGFMFFIRKFPGWYAGGRVITITHYTHFKFLLSKFSQIMAKIIIMNVGIDNTFLKFKFSQEIINNGEKCG